MNEPDPHAVNSSLNPTQRKKMDIGIIEISIGAIAILLFLYHYLTKNFDFWEKRNVLGPKPLPIFGNFKDTSLGKLHPADFMKGVYEAYQDEPAIGMFFGSAPILVAKDPDMVHEVLVKNFSNFVDRGTKTYPDIDPLSQHLVHLEPERWRRWRKRLSPVFASGKLKEMFYLINECADNLDRYLGSLGEFSRSAGDVEGLVRFCFIRFIVKLCL